MAVCTTPGVTALPSQKSGNTWEFQFQWRQGKNGPPLDLSGCQARMQVRHATTRRVLAEPDHIALDVLAGIVLVTFDAATTVAVPPGTHLTDLKLIFLSGQELSSATLSLPVLDSQTA